MLNKWVPDGMSWQYPVGLSWWGKAPFCVGCPMANDLICVEVTTNMMYNLPMAVTYLVIMPSMNSPHPKTAWATRAGRSRYPRQDASVSAGCH